MVDMAAVPGMGEGFRREGDGGSRFQVFGQGTGAPGGQLCTGAASRELTLPLPSCRTQRSRMRSLPNRRLRVLYRTDSSGYFRVDQYGHRADSTIANSYVAELPVSYTVRIRQLRI